MGEFDNALSDYSMAVSIAPRVALAYGHRSVLYAHLKRLDLAVNDATSFIRLASGDQCISAYQNRMFPLRWRCSYPFVNQGALPGGVWWAQMGKYEKAIADFTYVVEQQVF